MMKFFRTILKTIGILTVFNFMFKIIEKVSDFIFKDILFIFTPFSRIRDLKNEVLITSNSINANYKQFPDEVLKSSFPFSIPQRAKWKILPEPIILLMTCGSLTMCSLILFINNHKSVSTINFMSKIGSYEWIIVFFICTLISLFFYQHEKQVNDLNFQLRKENFENIKKFIVGFIRFELINKRHLYDKIRELNLKSNSFDLLKTPEIESYILEKCNQNLFPILEKTIPPNFLNKDLFGHQGDFDSILRFAYMEIDKSSFKDLYEKTFEVQSQN